MNEEDEKGLWDARSGLRTSLGLGFEVGANTLLDIFSFVPPAQVAGGTFINYLAQKIRGGEISKGELTAAGLTSLIPGGAQAGALTRAGRLTRNVAKGGLAGGITTTSMSLIDEGELPSFGEFAGGVGLGGAFGGAFDLAPAAITGRLGTEVSEIAGDTLNFTSALRNKIKNPLDTENMLTVYAASADDIAMSGFTRQRQTVDDYINRAYQHRFSRAYPDPDPVTGEVTGVKQNLMKGFDETITNDSGQEFILVKKPKLVNKKDIASKENYTLRSLKDVELKIAERIGYDIQVGDKVKYMKQIRRELNRISNENPKLYLSALMEYGDVAYLEHKIARGFQRKFWTRVEANRPEDVKNGLFQWTGAKHRNSQENIRLLFDPNYKKLKDTTEKRLQKILQRNNLETNQAEAFVITIEDPNESIFKPDDLFVRSNPGNIQIRKAGTGEIVGVIPDFYRQIYSTQFQNAFNKYTGALTGPNVPKQLQRLANEDILAYRERIINTMLDDAVFGRTSMLGFESRYIDELTEFYSFFEELEKKTGIVWARKPSWVDDILKNRSKFLDPAEADIEKFSRQDELGIIRDKTGKVIELDVDTEAELKHLKELEDIVRNMPREQTGRYSGSVLTSLRGERRRLLKDIDRIRQKYNLGKYQYKQQELNL